MKWAWVGSSLGKVRTIGLPLGGGFLGLDLFGGGSVCDGIGEVCCSALIGMVLGRSVGLMCGRCRFGCGDVAGSMV